ncbi:MAG: ATP-binding protein [Candidatus Omnitrophota bacterium]
MVIESIFERKIYKKIKPYIETRDIVVIHGARQTGKTTLLKHLMKDIPAQDSFYMDLENSKFLEMCEEGVDSIVAYIKQQGIFKNQERFYVLIDEIQYLSNPSSLLKLAHDHYPYLKLIVSGSSSFEIKKKFKDSLVGRTVDFEIYPLDFEEFLTFKNKRFNLEEKITSPILIDELEKLYREYVLYGGYPKIVLTDPIEMKEMYLQQIVDTYVKKDISDLAGIKHVAKFNKLLRVLANQSGQLLNVTELSNTTQLAKQTVDEYLFLLENTYIIKLLHPYARNIRSELFKTPKLFFYDTGLLHLLWFKTLPLEILGNVFENSIFCEFVKNMKPDHIHYWRTQDKKEIDFIIDEQLKAIPVEVKINAAALNYTSMKLFLSQYKPDKAFCISLEGEPPPSSIDIISIKPWEYRLYGKNH